MNKKNLYARVWVKRSFLFYFCGFPLFFLAWCVFAKAPRCSYSEVFSSSFAICSSIAVIGFFFTTNFHKRHRLVSLGAPSGGVLYSVCLLVCLFVCFFFFFFENLSQRDISVAKDELHKILVFFTFQNKTHRKRRVAIHIFLPALRLDE